MTEIDTVDATEERVIQIRELREDSGRDITKNEEEVQQRQRKHEEDEEAREARGNGWQ